MQFIPRPWNSIPVLSGFEISSFKDSKVNGLQADTTFKCSIFHTFKQYFCVKLHKYMNRSITNIFVTLTHCCTKMSEQLKDTSMPYWPPPSPPKWAPALPEWSFEKESLLRYQLRGGGSPRQTHAQLLLRTRASASTLLSMASRDTNEYIILEVRGSQPLLP